MKWLTTGIAVAVLGVIAGCSQQEEPKKVVPIEEQARPASTAAEIVEDMAGKTDVKAGRRARAALQKIGTQERNDFNEVVP